MNKDFAWACLYVAIAFPYGTALGDVMKTLFGPGPLQGVAIVFAIITTLSALKVVRAQVEHE